MRFKNIALVAADSPTARRAAAALGKRYTFVPVRKADIIVALGGDGLMLKTLHANIDREIPIYGMNRGSVGFLLNGYRETGLLKRLEAATLVTLHPLRMKAQTTTGRVRSALAINEVSLLRQTSQAAKLRIRVDSTVRMKELISDGVLVATPAGSTAYNLSAHGPILPLGTELLALTPISAFRPRRWRGALLPANAKIRVDVLEPASRPVSVVADDTETRNVKSVDIREDRKVSLFLAFDPEHALEERIINEQFLP